MIVGNRTRLTALFHASCESFEDQDKSEDQKYSDQIGHEIDIRLTQQLVRVEFKISEVLEDAPQNDERHDLELARH